MSLARRGKAFQSAQGQLVHEFKPFDSHSYNVSRDAARDAARDAPEMRPRCARDAPEISKRERVCRLAVPCDWWDGRPSQVSHVIHSLSFGVHYPSRVNPLDNSHAILRSGSGVFQYFVKVAAGQRRILMVP